VRQVPGFGINLDLPDIWVDLLPICRERAHAKRKERYAEVCCEAISIEVGALSNRILAVTEHRYESIQRV